MSKETPANPATCATCPSERNRSVLPLGWRISIVPECSPPAREPTSSALARRSTMATSTPTNVNSPANIIPVGPPPAITTSCFILRPLAAISAFNKRLLNVPHPAAKYSLFYVVPSCYPRSREGVDCIRDSARKWSALFPLSAQPLDNQARQTPIVCRLGLPN